MLEFISPKDADNTIKNVKNVDLGEEKTVAITRAESMDAEDVARGKCNCSSVLNCASGMMIVDLYLGQSIRPKN